MTEEEGALLRIYLDNCCYNRPYDEQTQERIVEESQAKLKIQTAIRNGDVELATSYMTEYENSKNPHNMRKEHILSFQNQFSTVYVSASVDNNEMQKKIESTGVKPKDACHVACAIMADCDFFLTTDDRLLKYKTDDIRLLNPIDFVKLLEV